MKVGIVTIATGKYDIFIDGLVESCNKYFLPGLEKKYFVFTDSENIESSENLIRVEQQKLGWPFDTMMRFYMFNTIKKQLEEFDYIFFMNANMKIVSTVGSSILETPNECGLIVTLHPGFYLKPRNNYPLERNPASSFYFPVGKEKNYFQGCFNGGKTNEFLRMSEELSRLIDLDLRRNIIPLWHDESALNWYMMEKNPKILDPTFAYPDCFVGDPARDNHYEIIKKFGDPKILQLNKDDFGGKKELREQYKNTMIDLKNCTLIIPIKVEHSDRYRNAKTVLGFLNQHLETNVFIYEICEDGISKLDFLDSLKNLKIKHWKSEDEGIFHRTKYLNIMLDDVQTPVVANYDIDVIIPAEFYKKITDTISNGNSDVIYPYRFGSGGQRRVLDNFDYPRFYENEFDLNHIDVTGPWNDYDSEYGHCIFFNTDIYKKYGAENENFVSYGPEDKERGERFQKMGFNVNWMSDCRVYHFEHYRGMDSSELNPNSKKNWDVFDKCKTMDKQQTIEYYKNQGYNKKYKTIG